MRESDQVAEGCRVGQAAVLRVRCEPGLGEPGDVRLEPGDMAATGRAASRAHSWVLGLEEVAVPRLVAGGEAGHRQPPAAAPGQPGRAGSGVGVAVAGADQPVGWSAAEWALGGLSRWFLVLDSFNSNAFRRVVAGTCASGWRSSSCPGMGKPTSAWLRPCVGGFPGRHEKVGLDGRVAWPANATSTSGTNPLPAIKVIAEIPGIRV